ncbi:MAG: DUF998 domain-containing protein [Thermoleophilia bacterium]
MASEKHTSNLAARAAGALLFVAGAAAFMGIITAESLYPSDYTTGGSMISDLGGTEPPDSIIVQPSALIFDTTMIVAGVLITLGAACAYAAYGRKSLAIPLALFGIGAAGVGVFPGHTGAIHALFAQLTFISGGVAAILSYRSLTSPLRYMAVGLGMIALVNLGAYILFTDDWFVANLGLGGLERWIAYPLLFWLVGLGGYLMGSLEARAEPEEHTAPADRSGRRGRRGPVLISVRTWLRPS